MGAAAWVLRREDGLLRGGRFSAFISRPLSFNYLPVKVYYTLVNIGRNASGNGGWLSLRFSLRRVGFVYRPPIKDLGYNTSRQNVNPYFFGTGRVLVSNNGSEDSAVHPLDKLYELRHYSKRKDPNRHD